MRHLDHAKGAPCHICEEAKTVKRPAVRCTDEELNELYGLLDELGLKPKDLVRQLDLRRQGKRVRIVFLSELTSVECQERIAECRAVVDRQGAR